MIQILVEIPLNTEHSVLRINEKAADTGSSQPGRFRLQVQHWTDHSTVPIQSGIDKSRFLSVDGKLR
jgi:hypothetical protein